SHRPTPRAWCSSPSSASESRLAAANTAATSRSLRWPPRHGEGSATLAVDALHLAPRGLERGRRTIERGARRRDRAPGNGAAGADRHGEAAARPTAHAAGLEADRSAQAV